MKLIDSHCHLDFHRFEPDRDQVIARAAAAGVTHMVVPAVDRDNLDTVLSLAAAHPSVYAAVGIHPTSTAGWQPDWIDLIREKAAAAKVVAVGEIGLDFYWDKSPPETQRQALAAQLALAAELELPVILHNREATEALIQQLAVSPAANRERAGVLHSFSAGWDDAQQFLEMGFYIGITGPITFKNADELRQVAANVPIDRLLIETDAPFLAPQQRRGKRNEPAYVAYVAERIAELRGVSPDEIGRQTSENAARLFRLEAGN